MAAAALALCSCGGPQWTKLFNGKDLSGWHQATGDSEYSVDNGCIVGTYRVSKGGGNSFLVTDASYSDFILEFKYKMEASGNSGIQFRSFVRDNGKVGGYQFEIEGKPERGWGGGLYDEGVTWIYPLTYNQPARKAQKYGEWNKGRIECIGNHIRTFVNGVECADVLACDYSDGFIGLQVHATKDEKMEGKQIFWKDIRILTEDLDKYVTPKDESVYQLNWIPNTISEVQKAEGWKLLWDGKTSKGWHSARAEEFPADGWAIHDGVLEVIGGDGAESVRGGDIVTDEMYENFELSVDFKLTKGANSGIKYFVRPDLYDPGMASAIGCEFQLLDDVRHPDAKKGKDGNRTLGSLYDLITSDKSEAGFHLNQWNKAVVKVNGNHVEHWLNGVKILSYDRNTPEFNELVAGSKYKDWVNFGNHAKGYLLLQDHGDNVFFRNIMIKELPSAAQ